METEKTESRPVVHPAFFRAPESAMRFWLWLSSDSGPGKDYIGTPKQLHELARSKGCPVGRRGMMSAIRQLAKVDMLSVSRDGHTLRISLNTENA